MSNFELNYYIILPKYAFLLTWKDMIPWFSPLFLDMKITDFTIFVHNLWHHC